MTSRERAASDPRTSLVDTAVGPVSVTDEGPPDATPLLCVHGIPGSARDFRYLAPALVHRFRVIRVEMPGFGGSPPQSPARLQKWARTLLAVAAWATPGRFMLLGHSFGGGAVLLAAATAGDRLAGAVLLASMGARRHRAFTLPAAVYAGVSALLSVPGVRAPLVTATRRIYEGNGLPVPARGDWRTVRRHVRLLASVRFAALGAAARAIQAPALVLHAEDDRLVQVSIARELAALLPHGRLEVFPDGGHHLQKTRVAGVAAAMEAFFG